ncbi:translation initiation factor eIF-2B subunit beta, putative [Hepatocystis sp. ex Piliocolobus tephrosceles]|nr:translation initiation factor eIF-2B subunit beta, putative [Hepatocystis sp. ex Piliocolobus tephrosceles]
MTDVTSKKKITRETINSNVNNCNNIKESIFYNNIDKSSKSNGTINELNTHQKNSISAILQINNKNEHVYTSNHINKYEQVNCDKAMYDKSVHKETNHKETNNKETNHEEKNHKETNHEETNHEERNQEERNQVEKNQVERNQEEMAKSVHNKNLKNINISKCCSNKNTVSNTIKNDESNEEGTKSMNTTSTCVKNESDKEIIIKFEKKKKKNAKLKQERQKEIIISYWLKGIANILNSGFERGDIKGSNLIGKKIAEVLKKVVEISHWESVHDLIGIIKYLGKEIIKNNKMGFIILNIIRRVLKIIRTEHFKQLYLYNNNYIDNLNKNNNIIIDGLTNKTVNNDFIYEREIINFENSLSFYFENTSKQNTYKIPATNTLKHSIIEGITELIAEIDTSWEEAEQRTSYDLFMENDVILTMGYSVGVEKFLKAVNKKKDGISVIVVGGDINRNGYRMAQLLREDGVDTTYISDSAVLAVIPKVTKVVLGSVAVSSSGGAITKSGGYNIACSAQYNSKPVTIVLPLFKLLYDPIYDPLKQNELQPGPSMIYNNTQNLYVRIPKYDYIPENLISLYITELGPVDSFQLYNLTKKKYHPDDLDLSFD